MSVTVDTSVLVAGASAEHPFFEIADGALTRFHEGAGRLVAHAVSETYAVLSGGMNVPSNIAMGYIGQFTNRVVAGVQPELLPEVIGELAASGLKGGAIYDGLIAVGARDADLRLLSVDLRAKSTYERVGVDFEILLDA